MKEQKDISTKGSFPLGRVGVGCLLAFILAACQTTIVIPIDDTYYWEKHEQPVAKTPVVPTVSNDTKDLKDSTALKASIEYLNVQDTTVTIRINR